MSLTAHRRMSTEILLHHCIRGTLTKAILEDLLEEGAAIDHVVNFTCPLWILMTKRNWHGSYLMLQYGASPNVRILKQSIFLKAISFAPPFIIDIMLRNTNLDVDAKDAFGYGCVHYACERNDPVIMQMLLSDPRINPISTATNGDTAMDILRTTADFNLVQRLNMHTLIATTRRNARLTRV